MTAKSVAEMTLQEVQEFARKADSDAAAARENERLERLGIKKAKLQWTEEDHEATRQRVAAEEARRKAAAELPDARGLSDAEYEAALARQGIYVAKGLM